MNKKIQENKYKNKFNELIKATERLGQDKSNQIIKCLVVYKLGVHLESIFAEERDETLLFKKVAGEIDNQIKFIESSVSLNQIKDPNLKQDSFEVKDIENHTQDLYGNLWIDFDNDSYFNEAFERLQTRLKRNNFDVSWFKNKIALDGGMGGGGILLLSPDLVLKK